MTTYLITGSAGFIGFHVARRLLIEGHVVHGVDNLSGGKLCEQRLRLLQTEAQYVHHTIDIALHPRALHNAFVDAAPDIVMHLAARVGVRASLEFPEPYIQTNVLGTLHVLDQCAEHHVQHLLYASSSSVYGNENYTAPMSESLPTAHPLSVYAATKHAAEGLAHVYSHLYQLPTTGLRFFTVYGPWGRRDMAPFKFVKAILADQPITLFNDGNMLRDFTYVDDIVEGILRIAALPLPAVHAVAPWRIFNIGSNAPITLRAFVAALEIVCQKTAIVRTSEMQPGDMLATWADTSSLEALTGYKPSTPFMTGIQRFVDWYRAWSAV